ncbi:MAG: alpha/beta hydrolase [Bacteroidota bacterium]
MTRLLKIAVAGCSLILILVLIAWWVMSARQESKTMNEEARKAAPGKFIELSDGVTHYVEAGPADGKQVVLIHGGGITGMEVWNNTAPFLVSNGFHVLSYDLYGRGYSDRLDDEYTSDVMDRQLTELLQKANFKDTIDIICMSMGAMIALDYAAAHRQTVNKIVLLDPYATGDAKPSKMLQIPGLSGLLMTMYWYPRAVENQRKEFVDQPFFEDYSKRLNYFMTFKGYKDTNYSTWTKMQPYSKMSKFEEIDPDRVLLIYGARDPYFSPQILEDYKHHYPTLKSAEVADAGHMPHYERAEVVNPLIGDFLK